jgi:hypothetical protein
MSTYNITYDWDEDEKFFQGDTLTFSFIVQDTDITGWSLRGQFTDADGSYVKVATSDVIGGSDDEIEITDGENGEFTVTIAKDETDCFCHDCRLEVERELASGGVKTIVKKDIYLEYEDTDWTTA